MTQVATKISSPAQAVAERPQEIAAEIKTLVAKEAGPKRPINFSNLKYNESAYKNTDQNPGSKFFASLRKSDTLKMFLKLSPLASIFFFFNAIDKAATRLQNIIAGIAVASVGPLIEKFLFPFLDKYVNPLAESYVDLDKDIIWDEESKAEFNRALRQFFNYKSSVQSDGYIKPVGTRKEGMLILAGPPGTGKSAMAEGIASLAKKKLIKVKVSDVEDKYVGESEKNIERVFARAERENAILFFDEADALLRTRASEGAGSIYSAKLTNTFLQTFNEYQGRVLVVLASNTPDVIDPAIKSRGFIANIKAPNLEQRLNILVKKLIAHNLVKSSLDALLNTSKDKLLGLVKKYNEFTGRDIEASVLEAMHIADDRIRDKEFGNRLASNENALLISDLEQAFAKVEQSNKLAEKSALTKENGLSKFLNMFRNN